MLPFLSLGVFATLSMSYWYCGSGRASITRSRVVLLGMFYKQDISHCKGLEARKGEIEFCSLKYLKYRQVSSRRNIKELV